MAREESKEQAPKIDGLLVPKKACWKIAVASIISYLPGPYLPWIITRLCCNACVMCHGMVQAALLGGAAASLCMCLTGQHRAAAPANGRRGRLRREYVCNRTL